MLELVSLVLWNLTSIVWPGSLLSWTTSPLEQTQGREALVRWTYNLTGWSIEGVALKFRH